MSTLVTTVENLEHVYKQGYLLGYASNWPYGNRSPLTTTEYAWAWRHGFECGYSDRRCGDLEEHGNILVKIKKLILIEGTAQ